jgi:tetraprenyl-beta-curcumene synthase
VARAGLALVLANVRCWTSVAPVVRGELRRWESRARAIDDPELRALALGKLHGEGFHAEAAAMLATLVPRSRRGEVVRAIVALELLFDYLDGLTERPSADPLGDGERLFGAYTNALGAGTEGNGKVVRMDPDEEPARRDREPAQHDAEPAQRDKEPAGREDPRSDPDEEPARGEDLRSADGGYLEALSGAVRTALERLPATNAIAEVARASAARGAQAQIRMHAASALGAGQVEEWARDEAEGTGLEWRELLTGAASSVLAVHALIAAAADPATTPRKAAEIETAYLSTCTVLTLLDGLVDHEEDVRAGLDLEHRLDHEEDRRAGEGSPAGELGGAAGPGYLSFYEDPDELSRALSAAVERAAAQARALPNGSHHAMTLVGVVAYYTSAPGAGGALAAPIVKRLQEELKPLIIPTLALMRAWRLARRVAAREPASAAEQRASIVYRETHETGRVR